MSLLDDAQESWEEMSEDRFAPVPADMKAAFTAGYLAACRDLAGEFDDAVPTYTNPFTQEEVDRSYVSGHTRVWISTGKLAELNQEAGKDAQEHV